MKRNRIKRLVFCGLTLITFSALFIYWLGFWIISTKWKREFENYQVAMWSNEIEKSANTPQNFNSVFDTLYPYARQNKINKKYKDQVYKHLLGFKENRSFGNRFYSQIVAESLLNEKKDICNNMFDKSLILAYGLENFTTPSKCVDHYLNNIKIKYPIGKEGEFHITKGIAELSHFKFKKEIIELSEWEILELIIAFDFGNYQFDKFHNPELFEKRLQLLQRVLDRNRKEMK